MYHALDRGVERRAIFLDRQDCECFLEILYRVIKASGATLSAYCLMPNHFHLAIQVSGVPLAFIMQRILSSYAQTFNEKYGRTGHLFEGRHKANLCLEDRYLLNLINYIQMNPVRARLVARAEDWPWSSRVPVELPNLDADFDPWPESDDRLSLIRPLVTISTLDEIGEKIRLSTGFGPVELRSGTKKIQIVRAKELFANEAVRRGFRLRAIAAWLRTAPGSVGYYLRKNSTNLRA